MSAGLQPMTVFLT